MGCGNPRDVREPRFAADKIRHRCWEAGGRGDRGPNRGGALIATPAGSEEVVFAVRSNYFGNEAIAAAGNGPDETADRALAPCGASKSETEGCSPRPIVPDHPRPTQLVLGDQFAMGLDQNQQNIETPGCR